MTKLARFRHLVALSSIVASPAVATPAGDAPPAGAPDQAAAVPEQESDIARAELAFREGRALLTEGNYVAACPKLEESQRLDPALGTLVNLGVCYEEAGKLASAVRIYHQVAINARERGQPERETFALERIAALDSVLPRILLDFEGEAPASVSLDGQPLPQEAWSNPFPVDPGEHQVDVTSSRHALWSRRVEVRRSQSLRLVVPALDPTVPRVSSAPSPPDSKVRERAVEIPKAESGSPLRTAAVVLGGVGGVAAVVGSVFGTLSYSTHASSADECGPRGACTVEGRNLRDKAFDQATASTISFGVAAVSLAGAISLWFAAPTPGQSRGAVRVRTTASTGHVGVETGVEW